MNERKQLSISNQHIRVPRWCAFNFAPVQFQCMLGMPSNSDIKVEFQKPYMQKKYWSSEKKLFTSWIRTHHLLNASQLLYPFGCGFDGMLLEFSPLLRLQPAAERNLITAFTRSDKLEVGGWWVYVVRQLIYRCRQSQASYRSDGRTDRQTDGRTDFQLYIYRLALIPALHAGLSQQISL